LRFKLLLKRSPICGRFGLAIIQICCLWVFNSLPAWLGKLGFSFGVVLGLLKLYFIFFLSLFFIFPSFLSLFCRAYWWFLCHVLRCGHGFAMPTEWIIYERFVFLFSKNLSLGKSI
jgi:hypothetical protein